MVVIKLFALLALTCYQERLGKLTPVEINSISIIFTSYKQILQNPLKYVNLMV